MQFRGVQSARGYIGTLLLEVSKVSKLDGPVSVSIILQLIGRYTEAPCQSEGILLPEYTQKAGQDGRIINRLRNTTQRNATQAMERKSGKRKEKYRKRKRKERNGKKSTE
jgi:hypothetical protein